MGGDFNKKQESRTNQGMQSASGKSSEVDADGKDLGSTAEQLAEGHAREPGSAHFATRDPCATVQIHLGFG